MNIIKFKRDTRQLAIHCNCVPHQKWGRCDQCLACIAQVIKQGEFDHIFKRHRDEAKKKLSP